MNELVVNIERTINASAERIFNAWLNPETLGKFMLPMPGMPECQTEVDARVGGRFTIWMQVGEDKIPHSGEYLKIEEFDELAFSWESPASTDGSVVTIRLTEISADKTEIKLTHTKFIDEERRNNHESGWGNILSELTKQLG